MMVTIPRVLSPALVPAQDDDAAATGVLPDDC